MVPNHQPDMAVDLKIKGSPIPSFRVLKEHDDEPLRIRPHIFQTDIEISGWD